MSRDTVFGIFILILLLASLYCYACGIILLPAAIFHELKDDLLVNSDMLLAKFHIFVGLFHGGLALIANHLRRK